MALFGPRKSVDPTLLAKLQADLAVVREDPLHGYSPERVLAQVQQGAPAASRPTALRRPSFVRSPRFWLLAATLTLLATAGVLLTPRTTPPAIRDSVPGGSPSAASPPLRGAPPKTSALAPVVAPPFRSAAQVPSSSAVRSARPTASTDDTRRSDELERELAQLAQIREALNRDPAAALWAADAGNRQFKRGVMHEEREALAVLALAKLNRPGFETRARRFLSAYPNSGFRDRISSLLAARGAQAP